MPTRSPAWPVVHPRQSSPRCCMHIRTCGFTWRHVDPPSARSLGDLLVGHGPLTGGALDAAEERLLWEIADEIAYQRGT